MQTKTAGKKKKELEGSWINTICLGKVSIAFVMECPDNLLKFHP